MTTEQLIRNLQSVGQACFIKYFENFSDVGKSRGDVIDIVLKGSGYTEKSCTSRTNHARRIIRAGLVKEALEIIIASPSKRVTEETRKQARLFLKEYGNV